MQKYADPKNDLVFKMLFGNEKNKDLLIDFINCLLKDRKVKDLEYVPTNLAPEVRFKKESIVDVLCTDENGSKYIVEMQTTNEAGFEKRAVYYASKTYSNQLNIGGKYIDLKEVIFIAITNFVMFKDKSDYISTHTIRDNKTYEHNLKSFTFVFVELPKFDKYKKERNSNDSLNTPNNSEQQKIMDGIDAWCDLLKNAEHYKSVSESAPIVIKKAYNTLEMTNWSEQELLDYQAYEKIVMDHNAREDYLLTVGIERGKAEGIAVGLSEGKKQEKVEIARVSLEQGLDVALISKITGLSIDEIMKIKD